MPSLFILIYCKYIHQTTLKQRKTIYQKFKVIIGLGIGLGKKVKSEHQGLAKGELKQILEGKNTFSMQQLRVGNLIQLTRRIKSFKDLILLSNNKEEMYKSNSSMTIEADYCHHISAENYFLSPKMPVKDHSLAFRSTKTSFKPTVTSPKAKGVLESLDLNDASKSTQLMKSMQSLTKMNLLKQKNLYVISHQGADKSLNSNIHTRQTNPGYSRNALGGIYTK